MSNRTTKRKVINRKDLDPTCPVDFNVIGILQQYGALRSTLDVEMEGGEAGLPLGCSCSLDTIKMIRKDVLASNPDILDNPFTPAYADGIEDAEIVEE